MSLPKAWLLVSAALLALPAAARAQSLEQRIARVDGTVRLTYAARAGVCGDGYRTISSGHGNEWESDCEPGPVRVALSVRGGRVEDVRTYVGGRWRAAGAGVTDLGVVPAAQAAATLLALAERAGGGGEALVAAATFADSATVWPTLLRLARADGASTSVRRSAVFWLGQAAGEAATAALDSVVTDDRGDRDVREQAIFALSQRPREEGVPALIRVARTNPDPQLRRKALFWLGQSEDPRALRLFEELLTAR